jgi:hypothetical protein
MIFKGMKFKKSNNLLSRKSKVGDLYADGTQVPEHHSVVVRVKDCEHVNTDGLVDTYKTDNAPSITDMTGHSLTNMFYGKWKRRSSTCGVWVDNLDKNRPEIAMDYYQCTVYLIQNGRVYKASIQRAITPKQLNIIENKIS